MKTLITIISKLFLLPMLLCLLICCQTTQTGYDELAVQFDGKYGQVEVGSRYAGLEFHNSWPQPARISFYYPVANSIDKSADYWKRYKSHPFRVFIRTPEAEYDLGKEPCTYQYTPFSVRFENSFNDFSSIIEYEFCNDLPVTVYKLSIINTALTTINYTIETALDAGLKTSHTFAGIDSARLQFPQKGDAAWCCYDNIATDSACVFVANAGVKPYQSGKKTLVNDSLVYKPVIGFNYQLELKPGAQAQIVHLIGSCRQAERHEIMSRALKTWQQETRANAKRIINNNVYNTRMSIPDSSLLHTSRWAKALLAANTHYIDGRFMPMPCPAEYNFFFTHDLLLTGFGAVMFDSEWIKDGYLFLQSLTGADSVLAHAYYWKDDHYETELCGADNWNHLWFIISASAYLKHSADTETVAMLYPILRKSLAMMLTNKGADDLMYAKRPDWWDIGNIYGARAYITTLMIRALQDYVYISSQLGKNDKDLAGYLALAQKMKIALSTTLWDEQAGYLMNRLEKTTWDKHYYSGSLLAVTFDAINDKQKVQLLQTTRSILLDENLGIRNAMPPDFHKLGKLYKFQGMEMGEPWYYFNGGIWSQGIGWYIQALLAMEQPDEAALALRKYLSLEGISASPNGQPSFFEYRFTDPQAANYGAIDKPTFLWAGGFYLNALYQLAGVRISPWNISLTGNLPSDFNHVEYDLNLYGKLCRVHITGDSRYFNTIEVDGKPCQSVVFSQSVREISIKRGIPERPYLAGISGIVRDVQYSDIDKSLQVKINGLVGQASAITIVTPFITGAITIDNERLTVSPEIQQDGDVYIITTRFILNKEATEIVFQFQV